MYKESMGKMEASAVVEVDPMALLSFGWFDEKGEAKQTEVPNLSLSTFSLTQTRLQGPPVD